MTEHRLLDELLLRRMEELEEMEGEQGFEDETFDLRRLTCLGLKQRCKKRAKKKSNQCCPKMKCRGPSPFGLYRCLPRGPL